jgi:hypothetical protein
MGDLRSAYQVRAITETRAIRELACGVQAGEVEVDIKAGFALLVN